MTLVLLCFVSTQARAIPLDSPRRTPIVQAVARATPAVVTIRVQGVARGPFAFFGAEARASEGSGVIIAHEGVVLTNAHVVDGASQIEITLSDGRQFPASVIARDAGLDLAVLRMHNATGLPVIPLGDSDDLLLGEPAIAIGNPYGLGLTVSTGVVASTARDVQVGSGAVQTWIQTDAAINPGNSGGALINLDGELIGVATFIRQGAEGIGFAIPVNRARKVAADLLMFGSVQLPWLGIAGSDIAAGRLPAPWRDGAVLIQRVIASGPGERAGLRPGDILVEVNDHRITARADLNARLAELRPGSVVALVIVRGASLLRVSASTVMIPDHIGDDVLKTVVGAAFSPSSGGLVCTDTAAQGTWTHAGLQVGDVLLAMDGQPVKSIQDVAKAIAHAMSYHRMSVWVTVARGPYHGTIALGL